jgi:hypothetical protein
MSDICRICCEPKELNQEHIIPQCLGGVLKKRIYCTNCNSELGHDVDAELAKNFGKYATFMNIGREHGVNQPFSIKDEITGLALKFDGERLCRKRPEVNMDTNSDGKLEGFEIIGRSEKELHEIFIGIAKEYNIDSSLVVFDQPQHQPPYSGNEFYLDNDSISKAIAKIAYGFACWKLSNEIILSSSFSKIRNYLKDEPCENLVSANYAHTDFMTDNKRPLHKIHLSINRPEKLVVGYVALFGVFRYTVLLSDCYESRIDWSAIDYTYDPTTQKEVPVKPLFTAPDLTKEQIVNPRQSEAMVLEALNTGMGVIAEHSDGLEDLNVEQLNT